MSRYVVGVILGVGWSLTGCHVVFSSDDAQSNGDAVSDGMVDATVDANAIPPNYVFITNNVFLGDFGGIAGANATCSDAAQANNLKGTFIALLGTTGTDYNAFDLLQSSQGWIRTDGALVAGSVADFTNGNLRNAIVLDEKGNRPPETTIWTGLDASGSPAADNCMAFTATNANSSTGDTSSLLTTLAVRKAACTIPTHLLCISINSATLPTPLTPPPNSKRIFLSTATFTGSAGLAAMDNKCANEAMAALGSNNFDALLSTLAESAMTRAGILSDQLFTRVDRSPVGPLEKAPLTFLNQHADGTFLPAGSATGVWTGGAPNTTSLANGNCTNWSTTGVTGIIGNANAATPAAYAVTGTQSCASPVRHVYCVEH